MSLTEKNWISIFWNPYYSGIARPQRDWHLSLFHPPPSSAKRTVLAQLDLRRSPLSCKKIDSIMLRDGPTRACALNIDVEQIPRRNNIPPCLPILEATQKVCIQPSLCSVRIILWDHFPCGIIYPSTRKPVETDTTKDLLWLEVPIFTFYLVPVDSLSSEFSSSEGSGYDRISLQTWRHFQTLISNQKEKKIRR